MRDVEAEGINLVANALAEKVNAVAVEDKFQSEIELISGASSLSNYRPGD
ncbi:hypothetical protein GCM10011409_18040 [Lentibacillus populi]|uniref:Uncharacterized protein n=1 Tax=Lentibacillus populi TaxID=1827502 RepID=A0A9W5TWX2_9BACI|nr:hypothetical protein [Lentibacillus populi]MBT2214552.1 hypothetical protein [Virgibacillus dakarensis]GGB40917.1 hypothetical protein GCM10011409_18040 [Lentibacillus populi]